MLRKHFALITIVLIVLCGFNLAHGGVGEATVIFLLIPPGARAGGMGEAFVAIADDATATWWNPAGLAFLDKREITFMHVNWLPSFRLPDLYIDFISYINTVENWGTFGFNVFFLNLGETERRDELNRFLGKFVTFETAFNLSYGAMVTDRLALGLNVKFIYSHLADRGTGQEKGSGVGTNFAVDIGILHKIRDPLLRKPLSLGANLANLGPKMAYIDRAQADPIPTNLKFGLAWQVIDDAFNKLTLAFDMNKLLVTKHPDGSTDPVYIALFTSWTDEPFFHDLIYDVGMEYWYTNIVALRMGYWNDEIGKVKPITYGASFKVSAYRFDFSYISAGKGHPLTDTTHLSLTIGF